MGSNATRQEQREFRPLPVVPFPPVRLCIHRWPILKRNWDQGALFYDEGAARAHVNHLDCLPGSDYVVLGMCTEFAR